MSEAELHVLKRRMHHGRLNEVRRGEFFACVPVGYVKRRDGGIALDPDEQVRSVVRLILAKFAELGTVSKVHAYLVAHDVRVGLRVYKGPDKGTLVWHRPRRRTVYDAALYEFGDPQCQGVSANAVDQLIECLVLKAVEPAALELSLRAAGELERDRERLHVQWKQKLERVGYEVARAKRQYDAVDPDNRLVARELERQWGGETGRPS